MIPGSPYGDTPNISAVLLGQVRSRTFWPGEYGSKEKPVCKSDDAIVGIPDKKRFPWVESGKSDTEDRLDCETCYFARRHNTGKTRSLCQESWTIPLRLVANGSELQDDVLLLSLTSSGITQIREYFRPMIESGQFPFSFITNISLRMVSSGNDRKWAKPSFVQNGHTNKMLHQDFVSQLREVKAFLQPPPVAPIKPIVLG